MGTRKQQGPSIESTTALDIAQAAAPRAQTPDHRRFQTLLTRIAKARQRLQDWQEQLPRFAQAYQQQVGPLLLSFSTTRRAWAFELEQRLLAGKWSRDDRQSLSRMISEMAAALLDEQEDLDTAQAQELKALHDRHAEVAYDEAEQQQQHAMKAMAESATGVDLGDGPAESLEEMLLRARAQIQRANEQLNQPGWAHTASGAASGESKPKAKTAAQAARMAVDQVRHFNRVLAEQTPSAPVTASCPNAGSTPTSWAHCSRAKSAGCWLQKWACRCSSARCGLILPAPNAT